MISAPGHNDPFSTLSHLLAVLVFIGYGFGLIRLATYEPGTCCGCRCLCFFCPVSALHELSIIPVTQYNFSDEIDIVSPELSDVSHLLRRYRCIPE